MNRSVDRILNNMQIVSIFVLLFSILGLIIFHFTGVYMIHPSVYIIGLIIGIGLEATATTAIIELKRKGLWNKI